MHGHGEKLSRHREVAIEALLANPTIHAAAQAIQVNETTLRRWLKDPEFRVDLAEARAELAAGIRLCLAQAATTAVGTLVQIMVDKTVSAGARVAAAKTVLQFGEGALQAEAIETRIERLEQLTADDQKFRR